MLILNLRLNLNAIEAVLRLPWPQRQPKWPSEATCTLIPGKLSLLISIMGSNLNSEAIEATKMVILGNMHIDSKV